MKLRRARPGAASEEERMISHTEHSKPYLMDNVDCLVKL
jgi:hypothetical protein